MVGVTDDLIARYLAELKAGLRTTPERAGKILAEAEDHLRESAAAGEAMGITERDAQEAAIAAFGGARAVRARTGGRSPPRSPRRAWPC